MALCPDSTSTAVPCERLTPHLPHDDPQEEGGACPGVLCECGATTDLLHNCDAADRATEG